MSGLPAGTHCPLRARTLVGGTGTRGPWEDLDQGSLSSLNPFNKLGHKPCGLDGSLIYTRGQGCPRGWSQSRRPSAAPGDTGGWGYLRKNKI